MRGNQDHLYTALDENYITSAEFDNSYRLAEETGRLIGGFMRYLEQSEMKGAKFASRASRSSTRNPEP